MRMTFKVFAGNMFCGLLTITSSGLKMFRDREGKLNHPEHIREYYKLSLRRIS